MKERASICLSVAYAVAFSAVVTTGSLAGLHARAGAPVMAVFAPGTGLDETLDAVEVAGGRVAGFGDVGWVVALAPLDAEGHEALRRAGAWLLLDARRLAALCGYGPTGTGTENT